MQKKILVLCLVFTVVSEARSLSLTQTKTIPGRRFLGISILLVLASRLLSLLLQGAFQRPSHHRGLD